MVWQLSLSRDSTCTRRKRHRLFTAPISLHALKRCVYNLLADPVPSGISHRRSRKKGHRQPFFTCPEVHLPYTSVPAQPPSAGFPHFIETLCVNKHCFQKKPHNPLRLKSTLGTLQIQTPQFCNQAALERPGPAAMLAQCFSLQHWSHLIACI